MRAYIFWDGEKQLLRSRGGGVGGERLLSQARCLFKQTFAATTPRVLFQWTPWLWSPVNMRLIVKAIAPR